MAHPPLEEPRQDTLSAAAPGPPTPPPSLVEEWLHLPISEADRLTRAARWSADQELQAICTVLHRSGWPHLATELRDLRRPVPRA